MRLVFDPVREHFLKRTAAAEPYVEALVPTAVRGFEFLADKRLAGQRIVYDALTYRSQDVIRWIKVGDEPAPGLDEFALFGLVVTLAVITQVGPYVNPYTIIPVAMMDIRNLYNYYY